MRIKTPIVRVRYLPVNEDRAETSGDELARIVLGGPTYKPRL